MTETIHIRKSAGILIRNRRLLVTRSDGKDFFIAPGGKPHDGETDEQAVIRELAEELDIEVDEADLSLFGIFEAEAAGQAGKIVMMRTYRVGKWRGEPSPHDEVEELAWVSSELPVGMQLGSIFEHEVLPRLKAAGEID